MTQIASRLTLAAAISIAALGAGCASYAPTVPLGYAGPTATVTDTAIQDDGTKGQLFYLAEVDGKQVYSSLSRTRQENAGRGLSLRFSYVTQTLPATPVRLTLAGTHVTGAPIQELGLRMSKQFFEVKREISFTPAANVVYRVEGRLAAEGSDVWLVDSRTSARVTP